MLIISSLIFAPLCRPLWWAVGGGYFGKTNDTCEGIFQLDKNMLIATVINSAI